MTLNLVRHNTPRRTDDQLVAQLARCRRIVAGDEAAIARALAHVRETYRGKPTNLPVTRENLISGAAQIIPILQAEMARRGLTVR